VLWGGLMIFICGKQNTRPLLYSVMGSERRGWVIGRDRIRAPSLGTSYVHAYACLDMLAAFVYRCAHHQSGV